MWAVYCQSLKKYRGMCKYIKKTTSMTSDKKKYLKWHQQTAKGTVTRVGETVCFLNVTYFIWRATLVWQPGHTR